MVCFPSKHNGDDVITPSSQHLLSSQAARLCKTLLSYQSILTSYDLCFHICLCRFPARGSFIHWCISSLGVVQYGFFSRLKALACLPSTFYCTCGTLGMIQICCCRAFPSHLLQFEITPMTVTRTVTEDKSVIVCNRQWLFLSMHVKELSCTVPMKQPQFQFTMLLLVF